MSKNTGTHDFTGQEGHDDPARENQESEVRESGSHDTGRVNFSRLPRQGSVEIIHSDNPRLHSDASKR